MTPKEILLAAADLIEQPGKWTQGALAKDASGRAIGRFSDAAVCWCALGALGIVGHRANAALNDRAVTRKAMKRAIQYEFIDEWNDAPGRTASEVAAKMREAAETL